MVLCDISGMFKNLNVEFLCTGLYLYVSLWFLFMCVCVFPTNAYVRSPGLKGLETSMVIQSAVAEYTKKGLAGAPLTAIQTTVIFSAILYYQRGCIVQPWRSFHILFGLT